MGFPLIFLFIFHWLIISVFQIYSISLESSLTIQNRERQSTRLTIINNIQKTMKIPSPQQPQNPRRLGLILFALQLLLTLTAAEQIETLTLDQLPQSNPSPQSQPINFTTLNQQLQTLNPHFISNFQNIFTSQRIHNLNDYQAGNYLFLIGKMYLYDMLPAPIETQGLGYQSGARYLLAYFYLQVAAEVYENGDAYYYLAVLEYIKLTPTTTVKNNIKDLIRILNAGQKNKTVDHKNEDVARLLRQWEELETMGQEQLSQYLEETVHDMETHHLHYTQHNLFLASVLGQIPAKLSLAYMLKQGISTQKNCSAAIAYYLSIIKSTKIDTFEYPSDYIDRKSFERQLYGHKKLDLKGYGEYDPSVLMQTAMFDDETHSAYEDVAMKYMTGEDGFPINETLSVEMFQKVVQSSRLARIMLGFMYLKGRGVEKNFRRARKLFEMDEKSSKVSKETLLVMKFYSLGFENQKTSALEQMRRLYAEYEKRTNITVPSKDSMPKKKADSNTDKKKDEDNENEEEEKNQQQNQEEPDAKSVLKTLRQRKQALRTPMIKYLIGSLVISDDIKGDKRYAINLIDQAAKQGNTMALTQLGMLFIDGADVSYDCEKSANYFSKESLSHPSIQQRIQLAKLGIKYEKYMFSLIKYVQLMMVGYSNAFVNALYLVEVYRDELFRFSRDSWSIEEAKKNEVYRFLVKEEIVDRIDEHIVKGLGLDSEGVFQLKNIDYLTQIQPSNKSTIEDHIAYMILKITSIGILKHDISILKFHKYKQSKDINVLHQLANLGENSPHIFEARFLLGRYYHHTDIPGTKFEVRERRALEQYNRATKNKLLASLIYLLEGGELKGSDRVISHFFTYLTVILIIGIILYRQRNKKIEEIIMMEHRKEQELENERNRGIGQEVLRQELDQSMFPREDQTKMTEKEMEKEYKGPKFSEEEAENMVNRRNLMNIGFMMEEINSRKNEQAEKERGQDADQPQIVDDQVIPANQHHN